MLIPPATILLIADQLIARNNLRRNLEYYGHTVLEGENARAGLLLFNRESRRIDLVILDLNTAEIPLSKITAALQKISPHVRIAVCTSDTQDADLRTAASHPNVVALLRKPVSTDNLLKAVRKAFDR